MCVAGVADSAEPKPSPYGGPSLSHPWSGRRLCRHCGRLSPVDAVYVPAEYGADAAAGE